MATTKKQSEIKQEPLDLSQITIPKHRSENEIIADLEKLCALPGYAHAIAYMCWESNFISYGKELVPDDLAKMKSPERFLRSELSFLMGLMIKAPLDLQWPSRA